MGTCGAEPTCVSPGITQPDNESAPDTNLDNKPSKQGMSGSGGPAISLNVQAGAGVPAPPAKSPQAASPSRPSYASMVSSTLPSPTAGAGAEAGDGPGPAVTDGTPQASPRRAPGTDLSMPPTPNLSQERLSRESGTPPMSPAASEDGPPQAGPPQAGAPSESGEEGKKAASEDGPPRRQISEKEDVKGLAGAVESMLLSFQSTRGRSPNSAEASSISCLGNVPSLAERLELDARREGSKLRRAVVGSTGALTLHWCGKCQRWMRCDNRAGGALTFTCMCPEGSIPCTGRLTTEQGPPSASRTTSSTSAALDRSNSVPQLYCETCNVSATSDVQLAAHLGGKNHKRHTSLAELSSRADLPSASAPPPEGSAALHCDICDIDAPSAQHKEFHLRGQRHQRKEKQQQLLEKAEEVSSTTIAAVLDEGDDDIPKPVAPPRHVEDSIPAASASAEAAPVAEAPIAVGGPADAEPSTAAADAPAPELTTDAGAPESPASTGSSGRKRPEIPMISLPVKWSPGPISPFADDLQQQVTLRSSSEEATSDTAVAGASSGFAADAHGDAVGALPRSRSGQVPPAAADNTAESTPRVKADESAERATAGSLIPSGGSISLAAAHFCPVCGIIATSEANLEDHLAGRRHARRLQYIRNMPEKQRHDTLVRAASGYISDIAYLGRRDSGNVYENFPCVRVGDITLPSSMDLRKHLEDIQTWGSISFNDNSLPDPRTPGAQRGRLARTLTAAQAAADELLRSATAMLDAVGDVDASGSTPGRMELDSQKSSHEQLELPTGPVGGRISKTGEDLAEGSDEEEEGVMPAGEGGSRRHQCTICGITTTSAAHLEAHLMGRKHRRRVDVSNGKGVKPSQHYCRLCDITTTSADHMVMHVNGKAHKRRMATGNVPGTAMALDGNAPGVTSPDVPAAGGVEPRPAETPPTSAPAVAAATFKCKDCSIATGSKEALQDHLQGMAHRNWARPRSAGVPEQPRYSPRTEGPPPGSADGVGPHMGCPSGPMPMYMAHPGMQGMQGAHYGQSPMPHPGYGYYPQPYYGQAPGPGGMQPMWWGPQPHTHPHPQGAYPAGDPAYMGYAQTGPAMDMSHFVRQEAWGPHMVPHVMPPPPVQDMKQYYCELCHTSIPALEQYKTHLRSRQHTRLYKLQTQQQQHPGTAEA